MTFIWMSIALIFLIAKIRKWPKCLSTDEWLNKWPKFFNHLFLALICLFSILSWNCYKLSLILFRLSKVFCEPAKLPDLFFSFLSPELHFPLLIIFPFFAFPLPLTSMMMNFYYFSTLLKWFFFWHYFWLICFLLTSNHECLLKLSPLFLVFVLIFIFWPLTNDSSAHSAPTAYTMVQALLCQIYSPERKFWSFNSPEDVLKTSISL